MKALNIIGERYGRLVVVERLPSKGGRTQWRAVCDCGGEYKGQSNSLRTGLTKSCGCLNKEMSSARAKINITHGKSNSATFKCWQSMKRRCFDMGHKSYPRYGGRGITICERWMKFENFLADMGIRPKNLSLDRIDNNGNYTPENCKWSSAKEQARNRSSTRMISCGGEVKTLTEWAESIGFSKESLHRRLSAGWSIEKALATPKVISGVTVTPSRLPAKQGGLF